MKLIIALLFMSMLTSFAGAYSQNALVSVDIQNGPLHDLFDAIEKNTDYRIFYKSSLIDNERYINISAEQKSVSDLLSMALGKKNLTFDLVDRVIVITPAEYEKRQNVVSGKITDATTGEPLTGVNIIIEGTNTGTVSDIKGNYSIEVTDPNAVLVFSFVGYLSEQIPVNGQSVIDVSLVPDTKTLEEIIVVGYGVQSKVTVTGAVAAVKGNELIKSQTPDVLNSLTGHLPGLMINSRTGEPGRENIDILIRGRSTTGATNPLIIIDGIERPDLSRINPNDIEDVSVLKDASAAIYGARAANGVILITTKRGTAGPAVFNFTYNQGFSQPTRNPKMADAYTFAKVFNEIIINENGNPNLLYSDEDLQLFKEGKEPGYTTTDWFETMTRKYTPQSRMNLSVSGGNELVNYYLSIGKMGQDGHFEYGTTRIDRYNMRSNITVNATKYVKVGIDLAGLFDDKHYPGNPDARGIYSHLYLYQPNWTLFWPGTEYPRPNRDGQSIINWVSDKGGHQDELYRALQSKLHFDIDIPWIKGMSVNGSASYDAGYNHTKYFKTPSYVYNYNASTNTYTRTLAGGDTPELAQLSERFDQISTLTLNTLIRYNRQLGKHKIGAMVGFEQMEYKSNYLSAGRTDFLSTSIPQMFAGSIDKQKQSNDGSANSSSRLNYFGRATYDYQGKYLAEIIFRADGSPNFPENKRWGYFPGISVGWRISEESFMKNLTFINNLKIRASYGEMGNDSIPSYQYLATYNFSTSKGYVIGGTDVLGLVQSVTPNPNITWEVAKTINIGFDASLWQGLLGIEFDIFKTKRSNILTPRHVIIQDYTGLKLPNENIGVVTNHGFELLLTHRKNLNNELSYSLSGNISFARNKVTLTDEAPAAEEYQKAKGHPIGSGLYYEAIGIYTDTNQIAQTPHMAGAQPGDIIYKDLNGDNVIDSKDRKRIDQSYTPEIMFGIMASFKYKNIDFSLMFQGQENAQTYVFDYDPNPGETPQPYFAVMSYNLGNFLQWRADGRWAPDNTEGATMPRGSSINFNNNTLPSTHWLLDAGFLRLKNLEIGYTLPKKITDKFKIKNLRAYVSGYNLLIIYDHMKDLGFDPETNDFWYYPPQRIYNFGFSLTF